MVSSNKECSRLNVTLFHLNHYLGGPRVWSETSGFNTKKTVNETIPSFPTPAPRSVNTLRNLQGAYNPDHSGKNQQWLNLRPPDRQSEKLWDDFPGSFTPKSRSWTLRMASVHTVVRIVHSGKCVLADLGGVRLSRAICVASEGTASLLPSKQL